jgi:hypothetical protein
MLAVLHGNVAWRAVRHLAETAELQRRFGQPAVCGGRGAGQGTLRRRLAIRNAGR